MKVLSNEVGAFMKVDVRFAHYIMNNRGDRLDIFLMWILYETLTDIRLPILIIKNVNAIQQEIWRVKTNQKNTRIKNCFKCGMLNLECALPFTIHIHDRFRKFEWIRY
jgi:hypothetical protein